jgi:hypothetical protein
MGFLLVDRRGCDTLLTSWDRKDSLRLLTLVGKLGISFVSVGSVYCSMKTFVTFSRTSSRFCESCVGLPTCLYTGTLNWIWKNPRGIDRTSFLCTLTRTETGGRVSPLSPGFAFCNHWSIIFDIPSPSLPASFTTLPQKKVGKKIPGPVTLMQNNSVALGLSAKIIKWFDSQISGFSIHLPPTVFHFSRSFRGIIFGSGGGILPLHFPSINLFF